MPHSESALATSGTVVALFTDQARVHDAIHDLREVGFTRDQIGIAMQEPSGEPRQIERAGEEKTEEVTVGAITGGVLGSLVGLISSLLIPGLGPVLVGGLMASLIGAGVGAATGGIVGSLVGVGVPEHDARYFEAGLRSGGTLVTVSAGARLNEALAVLQHHEADLGIGTERRTGGQQSYTGPERRLARV